ncbi:MAG: triose-phosphate isomerase [Sandaracinaceae bacterium]|nr:triose-phosphate isomerase [Sandaracinaceae bacterium]
MNVKLRKPLIAGNWKMYKTAREAAELVAALIERGAEKHGAEVVIAPPFTLIAPVLAAMGGSRIGLAAQNCHFEKQGAFTGEVSAEQVREAGCTYCIVGHSERRQLFGETSEIVGKKAKALLSEAVHPIVCVGETLAERESGSTLKVVIAQLDAALVSFGASDIAKVVVAYEPVWAIGTGRTASPKDAQDVHAVIRARLLQMFPTTADTVRVLYGGSVKPDNAKALLAERDIDGALVGGASLDAGSFISIIEATG